MKILLYTFLIIASIKTYAQTDEVSFFIEKIRETDEELAMEIKFVLGKTIPIILQKNMDKYEKMGFKSYEDQYKQASKDAIFLLIRYLDTSSSAARLLYEDKGLYNSFLEKRDSLFILNGLEKIPYLDSILLERVKRTKKQYGLN